MKLFTKEIDKKLFAQYPKGNNLEEQNVVSKVFNPYGKGRWYFLNSDPEDPDYLWAIVQMGDVVEIGSVSRKELESIRVSPFRFPLERDLGFRGTNAYELWKGLKEGKHYKNGGWVDAEENKHMVLNRAEGLEHHADELEEAAKKADHVPAWVVAKVERASSDIADSTHYLDGENEMKREEVEGEEEYAKGGELKWQDAELGDSALVVSENKIGVIIKPYGRKFHLKFVDGTEKTYDASELKFFGDIDDFDRGGKIKSGKKIKYKGKEGTIISKKGDMYFVEIENYHPNGDSLHIVLREEDFEKMAEGGETDKEDFLEDVSEMHDQIKSITLKDDSVISHNELMKAHKMAHGGMVAGRWYKDKSGQEFKYIGKIDSGVNKGKLFVSDGSKSLYKDVEDFSTHPKENKLFGFFEKGGKTKKDFKVGDKVVFAHNGKFFVRNKENFKRGVITDIKQVGDLKIKLYTLKLDNGTEYHTYNKKELDFDPDVPKMAEGGEVKFKDKVASVKAKLLKNKKVPKAVQKDYGKTFTPKEAEDSAKRIIGAQTARERLLMRMGKRKKKK